MKQELSVWSLIENHEFEKACEKADEEYRTKGYITDLRNKVYALFHLKRYNEAISLSQKIIDFEKGEADHDFLFLGMPNGFLEIRGRQSRRGNRHRTVYLRMQPAV